MYDTNRDYYLYGMNNMRLGQIESFGSSWKSNSYLHNSYDNLVRDRYDNVIGRADSFGNLNDMYGCRIGQIDTYRGW